MSQGFDSLIPHHFTYGRKALMADALGSYPREAGSSPDVPTNFNNVACPSLVKGARLGSEYVQQEAVGRGFESHRGDQFSYLH